MLILILRMDEKLMSSVLAIEAEENGKKTTTYELLQRAWLLVSRAGFYAERIIHSSVSGQVYRV